MSEVKSKVLESFRAVEKLICDVDVPAVERVIQRLQRAREEGATIYICGNGGSAATASHWVNDLGKATKVDGRSPIRVMSLSDNISWLTALANDEGYDRIFSGQLENFGRAGDVLIAISASGNSPNLLRAVEMARSRKMTCIGFLGFDGGALKGMVDDAVWIPTEKGAYGLVESVHVLLCHIMTECLIKHSSPDQRRPEAAFEHHPRNFIGTNE
jgi:D-sedoheptulose 7-phosphate isomerase